MIALLFALAWAQEPSAALPAGHPPTDPSALPAGHPPTDAAALPAGHPPTEAAPTAEASVPTEAGPTAEAPAPTEIGAPPAAPTAIDPSVIVGPPAGPPLSGEALREQTHIVAKLMRCPVCQGLSVADSPSESALAMKKEVEDLVAKGYDQEQILLYFETSYGEFIRLEPKFEGVNVLVWAAPVALVVLGGGWIGWSVRRKRNAASTSAATSPAPEASDLPAGLDPALVPYLRRVREETR